MGAWTVALPVRLNASVPLSVIFPTPLRSPVAPPLPICSVVAGAIVVPPECATLPVTESVPPPWTATVPAPVTPPGYVEESERLKSRTAEAATVESPARRPAVPPLPIWSAPTLTVLPPVAVFVPVRMSVPPPCLASASVAAAPLWSAPAKMSVPAARFTVSSEFVVASPFSTTGEPGTALVERPVTVALFPKSWSFVPTAADGPKVRALPVPSALALPSFTTPPLITTPPVNEFALLIVSVPVPLFTRFVVPMMDRVPCKT